MLHFLTIMGTDVDKIISNLIKNNFAHHALPSSHFNDNFSNDLKINTVQNVLLASLNFLKIK